MTGVRWSTVTRVRWPIVAIVAALLAGCTPLHMSDINTTSTARPPTFDVGELSREPVATVALVAPGGLAGFNVSLSHALVAALAKASPPIRGIPAHEIANAVNDLGLAVEYSDLLTGFALNGVMERERLQRLGSALGFRYLLVPGLAELGHVILDRFEFSGLKIIRTRVTVLRVWLQLWDAQTGHLLWQSAGEVATASEVVRHDRFVPLDDIAEKLWRRMIQKDLLEGGTGSRSLLDM
jgi:hypothetical protein